MQKRTAIYLRQHPVLARTEQELPDNLAQAIRDRGDILAGTYIDDGHLTGKGKNSGWRRLVGDLDAIDQIVLADPGDLPGRTIGDLLVLLACLTAHGVAVVVPAQEIDTSTGPVAILDLIAAYRTKKLSQAIRAGQTKAKAAGKHVGRPPIPDTIRRKIIADLTYGAGTRPTARKFGVSAASVVNIKLAMLASLAEAA